MSSDEKTIYTKLEPLLKRVNAEHIRFLDRDLLSCYIYGFKYIIVEKNSNICYFRVQKIDNVESYIKEYGIGIINDEMIEDMDNILAPKLVYAKVTSEPKNVIKIQHTSPEVSLFFLCYGDFFYLYENCYTSNAVSAKSVSLCTVC